MKIAKNIFKWLLMVPLGILLGIYSVIYYFVFSKSPIIIKKIDDNNSQLNVDFHMWKYLFKRK